MSDKNVQIAYADIERSPGDAHQEGSSALCGQSHKNTQPPNRTSQTAKVHDLPQGPLFFLDNLFAAGPILLLPPVQTSRREA